MDEFADNARGVSDPATGALEITPNDSADLAQYPRALFVGGAGNLRVTMLDGQTVTFNQIPDGWHPLRVKRVHATGTTATNIVGVW